MSKGPQPQAAPGTAALRGQVHRGGRAQQPPLAQGRHPGVLVPGSLCLGLPVTVPLSLQGRTVAPPQWTPCSWRGLVPRISVTPGKRAAGAGWLWSRERPGGSWLLWDWAPGGPGLSPCRGAQQAACHRRGSGLEAQSHQDLLLPLGTGVLFKGLPSYPRFFCYNTE